MSAIAERFEGTRPRASIVAGDYGCSWGKLGEEAGGREDYSVRPVGRCTLRTAHLTLLLDSAWTGAALSPPIATLHLRIAAHANQSPHLHEFANGAV